MFDTQGAFDKFIGNVQAEAFMFATRQSVLGNSATAGRLAEDGSPATQAALKGARAVASGATGHWSGALHNGLEALGHLAERRDPATNAAVANLLTTPIRPGSASANFLRDLVNPVPEESSVVSRYVPRYGAPYAANKLAPYLNDNVARLGLAAASPEQRKRERGGADKR